MNRYDDSNPKLACKPRNESNKKQKEMRGAFGTLIPELQRAVDASNYVRPTPVQEKCIPHLLEGRDLMATAQTGTGKTAAFVLPMLQYLNRTNRKSPGKTPRALILAPTRELAAQIGQSIKTYGRFLHIRHTVVFGGVKQFQQVKDLQRGVDIVVATPGRLIDLMQQKHLTLGKVELLVLDEVDRMLDMGFIPDVQKIIARIPGSRQTLFFSATMSPKIEKIARTMVPGKPVRIEITPTKPDIDRITQKVLFVGKKNKDALLVELLRQPDVDKVLVFTQMKHTASRVSKKLSAAGIRSTDIHGNKTQNARTRSLDGFRKNRFQTLVATDVAARGLDVDDITHVINYDLPVEAKTYIHRIGRTARAGAEGDAISFCSVQERSQLKAIESLLGNSVPAELEHAYHCEKAQNSSGAKGKGNERKRPRNSNRRSSRSGRSRRRRQPVS